MCNIINQVVLEKPVGTCTIYTLHNASYHVCSLLYRVRLKCTASLLSNVTQGEICFEACVLVEDILVRLVHLVEENGAIGEVLGSIFWVTV